MKKLISLLLVICILCPLLGGCVKNSSLSDELKIEIIEDYLSWSGLKGDFTVEDVKCTFLGKYGNSVAVYFNSAGAYDVATEETVAGYTFTYPDSRVIRIWNNGMFYKMSEAYEQKLIKKRHIKDIHQDSNSIAYGEPLFIWEEKVYCDYEEYRYMGAPDYKIDPYRIEVLVDINISSPNKIFDISFFENVDVSEIDDCTESYMRWHKGEPYRQYFVLTLSNPSVQNAKKIVAILEEKEGIREAKPQHRLLLGSNSSCQNNENYYTSELTWGIEDIEVSKVWNFTTGSSSVRVGIIDSGIASHTALNENYSIYDAFDFTNVMNSDPITETKGDSTGHGTHIAGVIGASWNNDAGIMGINCNTRLTQLRALYSTDNYKAIRNAMYFAASTLGSYSQNSKIRVINLSIQSWNTLGNDESNVEPAIREYTDSGGLLVCIAGNAGIDLDIYYNSEQVVALGSKYVDNPIENMISVGAIDINSDRWVEQIYLEDIDMTISGGSNYGFKTVDIYAPGVNILSTVPVEYCTNNADIVNSDQGPKMRCECSQYGNYWFYTSKHIANGYHYKTGTSMAAPFVTGVATLLLSVNPNLTALQLKECIINGAKEIVIDVCTPENPTVKKLNAWGAFKYLMSNYYTYESHEMCNVGSDSNSIVFTDTIMSIDSYSTFKENTSFIKLEIEDDGHYQFTASADNDIKLCLYDSSYELIISRSTYSEVEASAEFLVYLEEGTYYLKTNFTEEITGDGLISFAVNFTEETHTVSEYVRYTSTHHQCICGCGYYMGIEPHAIILSEVVLGIGHCMYCGARVMLGNDIVQVPGMLNIQRVTVNGSYILPSGIIVLVDEDIEAYENDTLVFYDKDKLPQIQ